jgi:hypothetical protein
VGLALLKVSVRSIVAMPCYFAVGTLTLSERVEVGNG